MRTTKIKYLLQMPFYVYVLYFVHLGTIYNGKKVRGRGGKVGREERNCLGFTWSPSMDGGRCRKSTLWSDLSYYQTPRLLWVGGGLCATETVSAPPNLTWAEGRPSRKWIMRVESSGKASVLTEKDVLTKKSPPPTPTQQEEDTGRRKQSMAQEGPD